MEVVISQTKAELGRKAAAHGAKLIRETIQQRGEANVIVATGASQFEMLEALLKEKDIAWEKVTAFHLDEYVGMAIDHPASFRQYLWERFHRLLDRPLRQFHYLDGETDAAGEAKRVGAIIRQHPIDVAFVGIGENGHLAFNDPPADFKTEEPYLIVNLDEACRKQQLGEGWFKTLADVPTQAISMGIQQILKSRSLIVSVPDERKAKAVQASLEGEITPTMPSSIMQQHADTTLYLDTASASLLSTASA